MPVAIFTPAPNVAPEPTESIFAVNPPRTATVEAKVDPVATRIPPPKVAPEATLRVDARFTPPPT